MIKKLCKTTLAISFTVLLAGLMLFLSPSKVEAWEGSQLPQALSTGTYYYSGDFSKNTAPVTIPKGTTVMLVLKGVETRANIINYGTLIIKKDPNISGIAYFRSPARAASYTNSRADVIDNYGKLTIEEGINVTGITTSKPVIFNGNSATAILNAYGVNSLIGTSAIENLSSDLTINSGIYSTSNKSAPAIYNHWLNAYTRGPALTINAGQIYGIQNGGNGTWGDKININGGNISNSRYGAMPYCIQSYANASYHFEPGVKIKDNNVNLDYSIMYKNTGKSDYPYEIVKTAAMVNINGKLEKFETVQECINKIADNTEAVVGIVNTIEESNINITNKKITLRSATSNKVTLTSTINVNNNASLTMDRGEVTLVANKSGSSAAVVFVNSGGKFDFKNGKITMNSSNGVLVNDGGTFNMHGGQIDGTAYYSQNLYTGGVKTVGTNAAFNMYGGLMDVESNGVYMSGGKVAVTNGTIQYSKKFGSRYAINNQSGTATITGGTFKNVLDDKSGYNVSGNTEVSGGTFYTRAIANEQLKDGYANYGSYPYRVDKGEAKVFLEGNTTGITYSSVTDAFASAPVGKKTRIQLLSNVANKPATVVKGVDIELDINGKTWGAALVNNGTLSITDSTTVQGKLYRNAGGATIRNNAVLTINKGTVESTGVNISAVDNYGTMVVNGGMLHHTSGYHALNHYEGSLTVKGGSIVSNQFFALSTYADTTITGGTIGNSGNQYVSYIARSAGTAAAKVNISGGKLYGLINGYTGNNGAEVVISNGTICYDYTNAGTGNIAHNYGAGVSNLSGTMVIQGGSITGTKSGYYAIKGNVEFQSGSLQVSGAINDNALIVNSQANVSLNGDIAIAQGKKILLNKGAYLNLKKAVTNTYQLNLANAEIGDKIINGSINGNIDSSLYAMKADGSVTGFNVLTASSGGGNALYAEGKDLHVGKAVNMSIVDNKPSGSNKQSIVVVSDGKKMFGTLLPDLKKMNFQDTTYYFDGWYQGNVKYTAVSKIPINTDTLDIQGSWVTTETHPFIVTIDGAETAYAEDDLENMMTQVNQATKPVNITLYKNVDITKQLVFKNNVPLTLQSSSSVAQIQRNGFKDSMLVMQGNNAVTLKNIAFSGNQDTDVIGSIIEQQGNADLIVEGTSIFSKNRSTNAGDAISMKAGTLYLDGANVQMDGDIYLADQLYIQMTAQPAQQTYYNVTLESTAENAAVVKNDASVESFGHVKVTNSGITLVKDNNGLHTVTSSDVKVMLKGNADDPYYNFGFKQLSDALANQNLSYDHVYYVTQDMTLLPQDTTSKNLKMIGAQRTVGGEYKTQVNIDSLGTKRSITTANGNSLVIQDNDTDQIQEYALKALDTAAQDAKSSALYAYTTMHMSGKDYDEMLLAIQRQTEEAKEELNQETTIAGIIDRQAQSGENIRHYADDHIVSVQTKSLGNGEVTGGKATLLNNTVTLHAVPEEGYQFDGWYLDSSLSSMRSINQNPVSVEPVMTVKATKNEIYTGKFSRILLPKITSVEEGMIHIDADGAEVTKVIYQYTGAEKKPYTGNWSAFVQNGPYSTLKEVFTDSRDIQIENGGFYNVIVSYGDGEETSQTLSVTEHAKPIIDVMDGTINVRDNKSGITKLVYQYTGETEKPYTGNWSAFAQNGTYKTLKDLHSTDTKIAVSDGGYYTFIITYGQKEYWSTIYVDSEKVSAKPEVSCDLDKLRIADNESNVSKIVYQYTGETEKPYKYWNSFTKNGAYSVLRPSAFTYKDIPITKTGYYTVILTYGQHNEFEYATTIYASASPLPEIEVAEQFINIKDNGSMVTKVIYQYTGETEKPYRDWNTFTSNGDFNISDDLQKIEVHKKGYYTLIVRYGMDQKEVYYTAHVTSDQVVEKVDPIPELQVKGLKVSVADNAARMSKISYEYHPDATEDPHINNWQTFSNIPYESLVTNQKADAVYDVCLNQEGWYTFLIAYNNGKEFYRSVHVQEVAGTKGNAMLSIDKSTISGLTITENPIIHIQYVVNKNQSDVNTKEQFNALYHDSTAVRGSQNGSKITVNTLGRYALRLIDSQGSTYYLEASITAISPGVLVNTTDLKTALENADNLLHSTIQSDDGIHDENGNDFEKGNYASSQTYTALKYARELAQNALSSTKQSEIKDATAALNNAVTHFKQNRMMRTPALANVQGNVITFTPSTDCSFTKIVYNVEDNMIVQGLWTNWKGFSSKTYAKVDVNTLKISDVPQGVYTFLIVQKENGKDVEYYETIIVSDKAQEQNTVSSILSEKVNKANTLRSSVKRESDVSLTTGERYVRDSVYNTLQNAITEAEDSVNNNASAEELILKGKAVENAMQSFEAGIKEKAETLPQGELIITVEDLGTVNIQREGLVDVLLAKGTHNSWGTFHAAGYSRYNAVNGAVKTTIKVNGDYTIIARYRDGSEEYKSFNVSTAAMPVTISEDAVKTGWINLNVQEGVTVEYIAYTYGTYYQADEKADFVSYDTTVRQIQAEGNGDHTVYVRVNIDGNIEEYYLNITVSDIVNPFIMINDTSLAVYTRGLNVSTIAYAEGTYNRWDDMSLNALYVAQNTKLDKIQFVSGDYTFFIKGVNAGNDKFIYIHI